MEKREKKKCLFVWFSIRFYEFMALDQFWPNETSRYIYNIHTVREIIYLRNLSGIWWNIETSSMKHLEKCYITFGISCKVIKLRVHHMFKFERTTLSLWEICESFYFINMWSYRNVLIFIVLHKTFTVFFISTSTWWIEWIWCD